MAYKAKFSHLFSCELKYNPVMDINPETPDIVTLWMKFFCS